MAAKSDIAIQKLHTININRKKAYTFQFVILFANCIYANFNIQQLTPFSALLYASPILVDLYNENEGDFVFKSFKWILIGINIVTIIVLFLVAVGDGLVDCGTFYRTASKGYWFSNIIIDKGLVLLIMLIDSVIPLILHLSIKDLKDTIAKNQSKKDK